MHTPSIDSACVKYSSLGHKGKDEGGERLPGHAYISLLRNSGKPVRFHVGHYTSCEKAGNSLNVVLVLQREALS